MYKEMKINVPNVAVTNLETDSYEHQVQHQQNIKSTRCQLDHVCQLDIDKTPFVRQMNIVCTIGPSSDTKEKIEQLFANGMNTARLNITLGNYAYHSKIIRLIREIERERDYKHVVAIAVDICAPTVRTGLIKNDVHKEIRLVEGQHVILTLDEAVKDNCTAEQVWVDSQYFRNVIPAMRVGDRIFIDDGSIIVIVRDCLPNGARCLIEQGGMLGSSKRVILPRHVIFKHAVAPSFRQNLLFAVENQVDMVFVSFLESAKDVEQVRSVLGTVGSNIKVVAKVETKMGLKQVNSIIQAADAVMVGRGDLGLELPPEKVFIAQKMILARCQMMKKPSLVVTQMLESMRHKPRATRAEVGDVANAVLDGADGLVLAVETARGLYPIESLQTMHQICREAESAIYHRQKFIDLKIADKITSTIADHGRTTAIAAVEAATRAKASAIVVVTTTGGSARMIANFRPICPVLTVTRQIQVARQCHLYKGLHPIYYQDDKVDDWSEDMDCRINYAIEYGVERGFLCVGDAVVIVTGWIAGTGSTNTVRIFYVPEKHKGLVVVRSMQHMIEMGQVSPPAAMTVPPNYPSSAVEKKGKDGVVFYDDD